MAWDIRQQNPLLQDLVAGSEAVRVLSWAFERRHAQSFSISNRCTSWPINPLLSR